MEPKVQISSQIIVRPQQAPKIIMGSALNFKCKNESHDTSTRPLMVNAWSQTTGDDFEFLHDLKHIEEQTEREKGLLEKIRLLEENLKAHSELLSQIHVTSARTSALLGHTIPPPFQLPTKPVQIQTVESQSSTQVTYKPPLLSPKKNTSPASSVINPMHTLAPTNKESVKYTIIAEGSGDVNGEPIEIQLAEEDGALNLNSSADSGRLEICLAPEDNVEIKTESDDVGPLYNTPSSTEKNVIKRRKLEIYANDASSADKSNFFYNYQGLLIPSVENANTNNVTPHHKPQKRRSSSSLLKIPKSENYNGSADIQTTPIQTAPIQSLMPSPRNAISSLSNGSVVGGMITDRKIDTDYVMVSIGPNNTRISAKVYEGMSWNSPSIATRKLLMAVFDRNTLATHSMTGKPSPAFKDHGKPLKQMLDPMAIQDIIFAVTRKCNVSEKEVRNSITTKCADENKMMKLQINKRTLLKENNKENIAAGNLKKPKIGIVNETATSIFF